MERGFMMFWMSVLGYGRKIWNGYSGLHNYVEKALIVGWQNFGFVYIFLCVIMIGYGGLCVVLQIGWLLDIGGFYKLSYIFFGYDWAVILFFLYR
ncbi:hypothetical protein FPQ18DRAFT_311698 [Pyronema domesticum]|nr:hypothetical protein FPQ18DRAFT_311698 [Pyronema domesticum]